MFKAVIGNTGTGASGYAAIKFFGVHSANGTTNSTGSGVTIGPQAVTFIFAVLPE